MNETEGALSISTRPSPSGPVVVCLAGELDHYTGPGLRTAMADVLRSPGAGVIADLSALDYCDSTGMTEIITAYHRTRAVGASFSVAGLSPAMAQLFRVAGLDQLLALYPSVEEAVDALGAA
ncbi:STAS domain-containing protein [Streptomyces cellostaticus]|uniref:STAS domain-containing protein n=1 Tax=Streptomyces cellostaticus TaxID=67285 RepID=UPI0020266304|nr:STAS domain-containing protein [Streptomyces cellostaticus]